MIFCRFFLPLGLGLFLIATASAQSFHCGEGLTAVERSICGERKLGDLDNELSLEVRKGLAADAERREALLKEERQWVKGRDSRCGALAGVDAHRAEAAACLSVVYEKRIAELREAAAKRRLPGSIDCARTESARENTKLICFDPALMTLDATLARELEKVATPSRRKTLLRAHEDWSWRKVGNCAGEYERRRSCLLDLYRKRIDLLQSPMPEDRLDICRRLGARYAAAFAAAAADKSKAADRPLEFLAKASGSEFSFGRRTELDGPKSIFAWAKASHLTLAEDLRKALEEWGSSGEAFIDEAPAGHFAASVIQGSAYCTSQSYFRAENGHASLEDGPDEWDATYADCGVGRWLGSFEGMPAAFEDDWRAGRSLTANLTVARRIADRFAPECRLMLEFSPRVEAGEAYRRSDAGTGCEGSDCDSLRRASARFLEDFLTAPDPGARTRSSLTPSQSEAYLEMKKLAELENEEDSSHGPEEFAPFLHNGRLYIASLAKLKNGRGDELLDRIVTLSQTIDGRFTPIASFHISVSRGQLVDFSAK
jgi:uncharacterized protein